LGSKKQIMNKELENILEKGLSPKENLLLLQFLIRDYLTSKYPTEREPNKLDAPERDSKSLALPGKWELTRGIKLYPWQDEAIKKWFAEGKKGTFKIVTGGGKTILALAAIEQLQNNEVPNLKVAIVVPTIVLMDQWYDEIIEKSNIPAQFVGRLGGGYQDSFSNGKAILICVLASASKKLPQLVSSAGIGSNLFLIIDECHRAGAEEMKKIFDVPRAFVMGLSATPERDDETDEEGLWLNYEDTTLGKNLGRVLMELTYEDALKYGLIPPFTIKHYGLPLTPKEQHEYDELTRSIKDTKSELQDYASRDRFQGSAFYRWAQKLSQQDRGDLSRLAKKYIADVAKRKMLLYRMENRKKAVLELLNQELKRNPEARILLFHESIEEANLLFALLFKENFPVLLEHSELQDNLRAKIIDAFRHGICKILVSVKSLIEGFNVPAVDVGIIVASSSAVRQRIQSMGRVMRAYKDESGKEKTSLIHILYARNTVDEEIYAKYNWDKLTGLKRNLYYHWDIDNAPVEIGKPPKLPPPSELDLEESTLKPGLEYPGEYEGIDFTCDSSLNIKDINGNYIAGYSNLAEQVIKIKGSPGRFKITPRKHFVLVQKKIDENWVPFYVTRLYEIPVAARISKEKAREIDQAKIFEWLKSASPGDKYPFKEVLLIQSGWIFSLKRGGVIAKKVKGGEVYARTGDKAQDKNKGREAEELIMKIKELKNRGENIIKLELNELNHILYIKHGEPYFIMALTHGLEFPD